MNIGVGKTRGMQLVENKIIAISLRKKREQTFLDSNLVAKNLGNIESEIIGNEASVKIDSR